MPLEEVMILGVVEEEHVNNHKFYIGEMWRRYRVFVIQWSDV